ncbi:MAG: hypothetical protein JJE50_12070 [Actinomycetales bacterium]|nr:hypothetical protein [Actinomycetales bacterium]
MLDELLRLHGSDAGAEDPSEGPTAVVVATPTKALPAEAPDPSPPVGSTGTTAVLQATPTARLPAGADSPARATFPAEPTFPAERPGPRRGAWAAVAVVVALLGALLIWQLGDRPDGPASDPTSTPSLEQTTTSPTSESSTPTAEAPPEETVPAEQSSLTTAVDDLRSAVAGAEFGDKGEQARRDLDRSVDAIVRRIEQDEPDAARTAIDELYGRLEKLESENRLSASGRADIEAALAAVAAAAGLA